MLGLGETLKEVVAALRDLRTVDCQRLTLGQYLRPSLDHIPVDRYWTPTEFEELAVIARDLGFADVRSGPSCAAAITRVRPAEPHARPAPSHPRNRRASVTQPRPTPNAGANQPPPLPPHESAQTPAA